MTTSGKLVSSKPKKLTPSRAHRNARHLQAFLERKQSAQPVGEMDQNELQSAPLVHQTEQAHLESDGNIRVWGHWCQFLVLQAQQSCDHLHRFILEHVRSHDGAQDQENACNVPRHFPHVRGGVWERD